jgi:hypothetical protein
MRYQCTECDRTYDSFDDAAHCCWGIGGVQEVPSNRYRERDTTPELEVRFIRAGCNS